MDWLQSNWIWLAAAGGFIAFHFFGHGGHGHGSHSRGDDSREPDSGGKTGAKYVTDKPQDSADSHAGHGAAPVSAQARAKQHRHGC